jgi:heat shock protein HslJ
VTRLLLLLLVAGCGSSTPGERWDEVQGAEWILWKIDGKPALAGAEVSLTFATGRLYGEAVNRYGANYSREEEALTIEPVGATKKHRDEPPGAMAQEARYLDLLAKADAWEYGSGWLNLKHGDSTVLAFKLKGSTSRD